MGADSVVSYGATIRGDLAPIRVGNGTVVGDLSLIKTAHSLPGGIPNSVNIGMWGVFVVVLFGLFYDYFYFILGHFFLIIFGSILYS